MKILALLLILVSTFFIVGCQTPAPGPSPIIVPPSLSGGATISLEVVQYQINAALANGKITQEQYNAAESLIVQAYNDVQNPAGVSQADLDNIVNKAIAAVIALELPIAPIPASALPKTFIPNLLTAVTKVQLAPRKK